MINEKAKGITTLKREKNETRNTWQKQNWKGRIDRGLLRKTSGEKQLHIAEGRPQ
tara:strand:+ start:11438 stop:11602 length:165 start_codon:yes stop_codon:yes gene_type:complete